MTTVVKYLIIGNSAGGIGAAEAIRGVDPVGKVAIVSDEPYPAYSRPLISEYLAEKCPLERMLFRPADFYRKNDISVFLGNRAVKLDTGRRTLALENGEEIAWEKLLLATGGVPIVPEIPGIKRSGTFTFTTLDDARAIDQSLRRAVRAVVVGGGLIGVSVTEALLKRGVSVTIVEMKDRLLNTILDEKASAIVEERLKRAGVEIVTGRTVAEINSYLGDAVTGVTLDNGMPIPCHRVILAIGVRPRTDLAESAGIEVNRGIVVDRRMATSCPDVYACGDAAEAYDFIYGDNRVTPIWPAAYLGGRVAGLNMAGVAAQYAGGTSMNSLKYFGLSLVSAGIVTPPDGGYDTVTRSEDGLYHKVVLRDGVVVGLVCVGGIERAGIIYGMMRNRVKTVLRDELVAADFNLAYLPEEIWKPELAAPGASSDAGHAAAVRG